MLSSFTCTAVLSCGECLGYEGQGGVHPEQLLTIGALRLRERIERGIHTYIHTVHIDSTFLWIMYILTYIHTYIHQPLASSTCNFIHTYIHTYIHSLKYTYIHTYIHT